MGSRIAMDQCGDIWSTSVHQGFSSLRRAGDVWWGRGDVVIGGKENGFL